MQNKPSKWVSGYKHGPAASYTQITRMGLFLNVATSKLEPLDFTWDNLHSGGMFISDDNKIYFRDETNKDIYINSPADNVLALYASSGVGIGTDSAGDLHASANNLVVGGGTGSNGITIHSAADGSSAVYFADGTSGAAEYDGFIYQNHDSGFLALGSGGGGSIDLQITGSSSDVTVSAGNLVIGTAGKGIDFSAQTPAAGMTAELLDHYEEGTCTLTCKGSSADPTSAVTETAAYTRVGRQVTVTCYFNNKDTSGASGDWYFAGLPFTSANEADWRGTGGIITSSMTITGLYLGISMNANATTFNIYSPSSGGAWVGQAIAAGTGKAWHLTLTYFV